MVVVRLAGPADDDVLVHALALAADWRPGTRPRSAGQVLAEPALAHYLPDRATGQDRAWVAEADGGAPLGAAWWRFLPASDPGYGFVSAEVPEVAVGVVQAQRGRGTGTALLRALLSAAAAQGLPGLSLSVEPDNPAARLYRRLGFTRVGGDGGADTMLLTLR